MKKYIFTIVFLWLGTSLYAQENNTKSLASHFKNENLKLGSYGGPFIKTAHLNGQTKMMIGGLGGVVFNKKIVVGGFGNSLVNNIHFTGYDLETPGLTGLEASLKYGGLFVEYMHNRSSLFHVSIPIHIGYGNSEISNRESGKVIEKSGLWVLEPRLNIEVNINSYMTLALTAGYIFTDVRNLFNLSDKNLSGESFGIQLKFGGAGEN